MESSFLDYVLNWGNLELNVGVQIAIVNDYTSEMLEKSFTITSGVAGDVAASVGKVRQDEESDDDEAVFRQLLSPLPVLFESYDDPRRYLLRVAVFTHFVKFYAAESTLRYKNRGKRKPFRQLPIIELFENH